MRLGTLALTVALCACTAAPAAVGSAPPSLLAFASPTPSTPTSATLIAKPSGTALVPTIEPDPAFANREISLTAMGAPGTPGEERVLSVVRPTVDAAYIARVTTALGVSGPGTLEVSPDGTAPWRLWLGTKVLAINERTGDVLFFDPRASDAGATGPARGPYEVLASLGSQADYSSGQTRSFTASEWLSAIDRVFDGSWLEAGSRTAFALFPEYHDASGSTGTTIFGTDEFALLTPMGRPVELIHRPLVRIEGGTVYPLTLAGYALGEVLAAPNRYLHMLSLSPTEPITLRIDMAQAMEGHAWAGAPVGVTHLGAQLVPVWMFPATGTTKSGAMVNAIFLVDGVAPQFRAPALSAALGVTADELLRTQLARSVGGHRPGLSSAEGVMQDQLSGICAGGTYTMSSSDPDNATASVSCPNGAHPTVLLKRAFPGLAGSIWYVSGLSK